MATNVSNTTYPAFNIHQPSFNDTSLLYPNNETVTTFFINSVNQLLGLIFKSLDPQNKTDDFTLKKPLAFHTFIDMTTKGYGIPTSPTYLVALPLLSSSETVEDQVQRYIEEENIGGLSWLIIINPKIVQETELWNKIAIKLANNSTTSPFMWRFLKEQIKLKFQYIQDEDGNFLCHLAAKSGSVEALEFLKNEGCNINQQNTRGNPPIILAASSGQFNVVEWYRAINEADRKASSEGAAAEPPKQEALPFLNTLVNLRNANIGHAAAFNRRLVFLYSLSERSFNFRAVDVEGNTLAHSVTSARFDSFIEYKKAKHIIIKILVLLMQKGLKLDQMNHEKKSPLDVFKEKHEDSEDSDKIINDFINEWNELNKSHKIP